MKNFIAIIFLPLVFNFQSAMSGNQIGHPKPIKIFAEKTPQAKNHETWDRLLRKYVSPSGNVDYKGLKSEKQALEDYLKSLEENPVGADWTKERKMTFWINAYNAFTIKLILDHYPVSSIKKIHGGNPWDEKWIRLNGQVYSLNKIEHDILRPQFKDARIHFAINCAAKSCPPLLNQSWTAENMDRLLDQQTRNFINNPKFNSLKKNEVEISRLFEWYAKDFGDVIEYLKKYSNAPINKNATVKYKDYNWELNE